jgi:hypothetical protein
MEEEMKKRNKSRAELAKKSGEGKLLYQVRLRGAFKYSISARSGSAIYRYVKWVSTALSNVGSVFARWSWAAMAG